MLVFQIVTIYPLNLPARSSRCPHIDTWLYFLQVSFDHPLFIMYSSGTTGKPKCMVHSVGGTLIKHLEEHQIQARTHCSVMHFNNYSLDKYRHQIWDYIVISVLKTGLEVCQLRKFLLFCINIQLCYSGFSLIKADFYMWQTFHFKQFETS